MLESRWNGMQFVMDLYHNVSEQMSSLMYFSVLEFF